MKKVLSTHTTKNSHWVGDGFPVRTIFSYVDLAKNISPFLLMDYAGPAEFPPSTHRRGVGSHPHRGFETVTIVYAGEVEHRDSAGGGGVIQAGDVQWMTAASGLVHEEMHGKNFMRDGGAFEMVQLWVNLPQKLKMTKPRYQGISSGQIPVVNFENEQGHLRVIAGEYLEAKGAAQTFTFINMWDIRLKAGADVVIRAPARQTSTLFVLKGDIKIADSSQIKDAELAVLDSENENFRVQALQDTTCLFLGGIPLNEPIAGYGPFVMNSKEEILQAFKDFEDGKMGEIGAIEGSD